METDDPGNLQNDPHQNHHYRTSIRIGRYLNGFQKVVFGSGKSVGAASLYTCRVK